MNAERMRDLRRHAEGVLLALLVPVAILAAFYAWTLLAWVVFGDHSAFTLPRTEWECVDQRLVQETTLQQVGRVLVPMPRNELVCDAYLRRGS